MTNRQLAEILKDQTLLTLGEQASVQEACQHMWESHKGSVLVIDLDQRLLGIFTGRDAVRTLAEGKSAETTSLGQAMTRNPVTVAPTTRAIDALREMNDCGIRHLPVLENDKILGVVSRGDFKGMEIDRLDEDDHLAECLR
jgi:CBS domain-containing protein